MQTSNQPLAAPVIAPTQAAPTQAAPAQAPPTQAPPAQVTITTPGPDGTTQTLTIPRTQEEVQELVMQRSELSDQLISAAERRANLSDQLASAPVGVSRTGLEDRIGVLDKRIIQIETDIASTGRQLALASSEFTLAGDGGSQAGLMDEDDVLAMGAFNFLVLIPLILFFARRRWKRAAAPAREQLPTESGERLERLEHAVGAIAIEIERVSEGQRFVTKLLSESPTPLGVANKVAERPGVERG